MYLFIFSVIYKILYSYVYVYSILTYIRMCEKFHQLLAVGRWFPPGTPVSSTRKLISSSFHRLDMTLAVAEALNPNKPNLTYILFVVKMRT